ncbi:hypothetical protein Trydic_g12401 [Trypoxylus dichotomus]
MSKLAVFCPFLAAYAITLAMQSSVDQEIHHDASFRILGGKVATAGAYPFIVSLRKHPNQHFCGGTIVNNLWILTAAHCMINESTADVVAVVGTNNLKSGGFAVRVRKVTMHPHFNNTGYKSNDIAMIQLRSALKYSATIAPVALDTGLSQSVINVTLIGWGYSKAEGPLSTKLRELSTKTQPHIACTIYWPGEFNDDQICTEFPFGRGFCNGDSGGPLIHTETKKQVGIVSFYSPLGCGEILPDVFGRVSSYELWIWRTIHARG